MSLKVALVNAGGGPEVADADADDDDCDADANADVDVADTGGVVLGGVPAAGVVSGCVGSTVVTEASLLVVSSPEEDEGFSCRCRLFPVTLLLSFDGTSSSLSSSAGCRGTDGGMCHGEDKEEEEYWWK